jgi:2-haloacid dehalogenase
MRSDVPSRDIEHDRDIEVMVSSRRAFIRAAIGAAMMSVPTSSSALGQNTRATPGRRRIVVFDVNETMLDVNALAPQFARVFGNTEVLREWFANVLLYSNVVTVAGPYADFGTIGGAALDMIAATRGTALKSDDRNAILGGMRSLPAHADVRPALERLRNAGFRLVTLTNSAPAAVDAQLKNAGIAAFFERSFSVDAVKRFKPAPEPYRHVARELGVETSQLRMIAAHAWDVLGAMQAGCAAAFIARPGKALFPLGPKPDIVVSDLNAASERIVELEAR